MTTHKINTHGTLTIKKNPLRDKPQHTPTPWKQYLERYPEQVLSAGGNFIADCYYSEENYIKSKANAAFIVTACNNHFALVEALKEIQNKLVNYDFLQSTNNNQGRVRAVLSLTATALAQVEKG